MITIRKIEPTDTPHVQQLIKDIMDSEFPEESKVYAFPDIENPVHSYCGKRDVFLVAEKNGQIIGTVAIKEDSPHVALLRRIFVGKMYRGKGYGEKLLQKAIEFCFDHHYQTVTFRGANNMRQALKLCLKQGFEEEDVLVTDAFKMFILKKKLSHASHK